MIAARASTKLLESREASGQRKIKVLKIPRTRHNSSELNSSVVDCTPSWGLILTVEKK